MHLVSVQVSGGDGLPAQYVVSVPDWSVLVTALNCRWRRHMLLRGYVSSHCEEDGCIKCQV